MSLIEAKFSKKYWRAYF